MKKFGLKTMVLLLLLILLVGLTACEDGIVIVDMKIISYPNKIVYVKDVDKYVSPDGLIIEYTTRDGRTHQGPAYLKPEDVSEVDFSKEGVYTVTIRLDNRVSVSFPVQVVSKEWMQQYLNK